MEQLIAVAPFKYIAMNRRENFTAYETLPEDLAIYLSHNGPHFNKAACEFAIEQMYKKDDNGEEKDIKAMSKKELDHLLQVYGVKIKNNHLYDGVYLAAMATADYLGSSIHGEDNMVRFIKDTLDDPDGLEGLTFNRWIADMKWMGIPIPWDEFI